MNEIAKQLDYNGKVVRTVEQNGEIWWVLRDVCVILGLSNPTSVSNRLDDDEKRRAEFDPKSGLGLSHNGYTTIINESGVYSVLLRSDKPEAKPFKRWVTHEVLPSIRKTGEYLSPQETERRKRFQFVDTPENPEAQSILGEMRELAISVQVMLKQYNCYRQEETQRGYAQVLESLCGRLYNRSADLGRVRYKTVYRPC